MFAAKNDVGRRNDLIGADCHTENWNGTTEARKAEKIAEVGE